MAKREAGARAGAKKNAKKGGLKLGAEIVSLAKSRGARNGAVPDHSNSGQPIVAAQIVGKKDEESFLIWAGKIKSQWKVVGKAKDVVKSEAGTLNGLYAQAKESGIPASRISTLKKRLKLEDRPIEDVVEEHKEMAWQVSVVKSSPLKQLGLFDIAVPSLDGYESLGDKAGYEGGHVDNAPGLPGEERHARWTTGFKRGQKRLSEETFNAGKPVAGDGEGEDALEM